MIQDNQLASGIRSKIICDLVAKPPVGSEAPHKPGVFGGGGVPLTYKNFVNIFYVNIIMINVSLLIINKNYENFITSIHKFKIFNEKSIFKGELSMSELTVGQIIPGQIDRG